MGQRFNILLANLPWQRAGRRGVRAGSRWPHTRQEVESGYLPFPFFLAYATSLLHKHRFNASIVDAIAQGTCQDAFLNDLKSRDINYLVAETSVPSFYDDVSLLERVSREGISIILCGANYEIYQPEFLKRHPFINYVLYGEYELSLLELVFALQEGSQLSAIKGLIYREGDRIAKNPKREPVDINTLPWPHRESLPMKKYFDAPCGMSTPSVQMMSSRGCPYACAFCLWPQVFYQGPHYRARDIEDVVDEMEYLVKYGGFRSVYFDDDIFNINKDRTLSLCRHMIEKGLHKTQWAVMARPDLMDEETLVAMKDAGLWAIKYGVECADERLLYAAGKSMDLSRAEAVIARTKELGIRTHLTFTFGLPGETRETIKETIRLVCKLDPFSVQFSIATPFPGTKYYEEAKRTGSIVSEDFADYDGFSRSVVRCGDLSPQDLQDTLKRAYDVWRDHSVKRGG